MFLLTAREFGPERTKYRKIFFCFDSLLSVGCVIEGFIEYYALHVFNYLLTFIYKKIYSTTNINLGLVMTKWRSSPSC